jgi:6-pyruvoyltetrahydropterin/6-carboxytetrahydropterin synthase
MKYVSTKIIELGSCAFRQWKADSHCKYIHGYRLVAKFWFECDRLDERNWVVDFGGLKELKQVLENQFDHTFCVSADDPLAGHFQALHTAGAVDLRIMHKGVGIERTAEWCFDVADAHVRGMTKNRCWVQKVEVWEHEKNSAIVSYQQEECTKQASLHAADIRVATKQNVSNKVEPVLSNSQAAQVGNIKTSGFKDLFAGTTWQKQ